MITRKFLIGLLTAGVLVLGFALMGCEGEKGPAGPAGAQGPEGPQGPPGEGPGEGPTFLGNSAESCGHCHSGVTAQWVGTGHSNAYTDLDEASRSNNYCLQCHTTGFDDVFDHDGNQTSEGVDQNGYDDNPRPSVQGVHCEACHGPMGPSLAHQPEVTANLTGESCGKCHEQNAEWAETRHGMTVENAGGQTAFFAEWGRSSCWSCHISEGYIASNDPDWTGVSPTVDMANAIGCATCHDAHNDANPFQLRDVGPASLPYGGGDHGTTAYNITGWGTGQTCAQCHHSRRDSTNIAGQVANGSNHPGPHESPQADLVAGGGVWELPGMSYDDVRHEMKHETSLLPDMCVNCHMPQIARGEEGGPYYGHEFEPKLFKCQTCHSGATNFDIGGVQTQFDNLMGQLALLLPNNGGVVIDTSNSPAWSVEQRQAGYTYYFLHADGSRGVHNPDYAVTALTNAINYLSSAMAERNGTTVRN